MRGWYLEADSKVTMRRVKVRISFNFEICIFIGFFFIIGLFLVVEF